MGLAERLWGQEYQKKKHISEVSEELRSIISDLTSLCPNVQILLFGSFAEGTATQGSDLDLAIILPDSVDKRTFRKEFFRTKTRIKIPVDFIFRNSHELVLDSSESPIANEIFSKAIEIYPTWRIYDQV